MKYQHFKKVWSIPLLLAVSIMFGLLAALLGAGFWYPLSWIAMIVPLVIIVRKIWITKTIKTEN